MLTGPRNPLLTAHPASPNQRLLPMDERKPKRIDAQYDEYTKHAIALYLIHRKHSLGRSHRPRFQMYSTSSVNVRE